MRGCGVDATVGTAVTAAACGVATAAMAVAGAFVAGTIVLAGATTGAVGPHAAATIAPAPVMIAPSARRRVTLIRSPSPTIAFPRSQDVLKNLVFEFTSNAIHRLPDLYHDAWISCSVLPPWAARPVPL